jgi:hypothetical protein
MPMLRILCYNGSLVTWTVASMTAAKFKPLTFSVSGFGLSYAANVFIFMIFLWPLFVACTMLLHNRVHIQGGKPCANRGTVCTLENIQWCREPCPTGAAILRGRFVSCEVRTEFILCSSHKWGAFRSTIKLFSLLLSPYSLVGTWNSV